MNKMLLTTVTLLTLLFCAAGCRKAEKTITSLDDAKNASIGVMTGTTGEQITRKRFPKAQVKSFDDVMDAVAALKSGQLEAIVTVLPTAVQVSKRNPDFITLKESLQDDESSIALRKEDNTLLADLNRIIAELKADGTLASMRKRWLKTDTGPYEELKLSLPKTGKPLKIGVCATREPLSFVDKDGRVTGHDSELARLVGVRLNRPVEFLNMKFMALIPALQSGKVDLVISGMAVTEERKKLVNFTQSYFASAQVMLTRKPGVATTSNSVSVKLPQINGNRICVLPGSAGDVAARKNYPGSQFQTFTSASDAALAIKTNKADALIYDKSLLLNLVEKNPELMILHDPVAKLEVAAALKKENTALLAEINGALQELKNEGELQRLKQKWIDSKYTTAPALPVINTAASKGVLRMGTSANFEPFTFLSNGSMTGLDIELGQLIGQRLGKKITFVDMTFEALIPALQSGKIDFALADFNVTEERKKFVLFSLPYIENDISALVRRAAPVQADDGKKTGDTHKLSSAADLHDKRIAVLQGSTHEFYAVKTYPKATVLQYKAPSDMLLAVKTGKADAAIYSRDELVEYMRSNDDLGFVGATLYSTPVGIGFHQQDNELRLAFNRFLAQIKKDGSYNDMIRRWMEQGSTDMPQNIAAGSGKPFLVGLISDNGLPFAIVKDNKLTGFSIELMDRFGAFMNRKIQYVDMEFGSQIAALAGKKIDMIAAVMAITDERKKRIDFSDPYYNVDSLAFALKKNIVASSGPTVAPPAFIKHLVTSFQSNILHEKRYLLILDGLKITVIISIFATLFGTGLGALICFMRMSKRTLLSIPAKVYIAILRGMPVLVLLMLIFYVVFASINISPVIVAVIAFGMNFGAYTAEIFRSGIEGIDKGQTEAGISLGFTRTSTFFHIVLPQMVRRILPVYKGEFISLVKMTSIVGYIAVQDLTKASDIIRSRTFDAFFPLVMVAILYFLISWALMQALEYLERITDPKYKQRKARTT